MLHKLKLILSNTVAYRFGSSVLHYNKALDAINKFAPDSSKVERIRMISRIIWVESIYGWYPKEYFSYQFEQCSKEERYDIVCQSEWISFLKLNATSAGKKISNDKWESYKFFKDYYSRKVYYLPPALESNIDELFQQISAAISQDWDITNPDDLRFIIKPLDANSGSGITIITAKQLLSQDDFSELIDKYSRGAVVEELIKQSHELGVFNPNTVNSIRLSTFRYSDGVKVFGTKFRLGRSGMCVDNLNGGGIAANFNAETGVCLSAVDVDQNQYVEHPDTHTRIEGFSIPKWDELVVLAKRLALLFPDKIAGWDFALTDNGWVLIEVNSIPGMTAQRHFRHDFEWMKSANNK